MYGQVLDDPAYLLRVAEVVWPELKRLKVNTVLVMGASGLAPAAVLSALRGTKIYLVRKEGENTHGYSHTPLPGEKFVILDDFIVSGTTMNRILSYTGSEKPEAIILYAEIDKVMTKYKGIPIIKVEP